MAAHPVRATLSHTYTANLQDTVHIMRSSRIDIVSCYTHSDLALVLSFREQRT